MSLTVAGLLSREDLQLRLIVDGMPGYLDRKVVWVHQSELLQSREFSEPGEILLTTGLNIPQWHEADGNADNGEHITPTAYRRLCRDYVQSMFEAGVLACGFGIGVEHDAVPQPLADAARREGLPLFEVPLDIPFQAIVRAVSRSIAEDEHRLMRATYAAQRRLISAAGDEYPMHSVILRTAESVGGWAAFLGPDGKVIDISHIAPRSQAEQLGVELLAQREDGPEGHKPRTMFLLKDGYDYCASEVRGAGQTVYGFVLAGIKAPEETDMALRSVVIVAAEILSACLPQRVAADRRQRHMRAVMMRALALGHVDILRDIAADLWGALPRGPVQVVCVAGDQRVRDELYERLSAQTDYPIRQASHAQASSAPVIFGDYDDRFWIICAQRNVADLTRTVNALRSCGTTDIGIAPPSLWENVTAAFEQARIAARVCTMGRVMGSGNAAQPGTSGNAGLERIGEMSQVDLMEPDVADTYALAVLAPLVRGHGQPQTRQVLLDTLMALMEASLNVTVCARRMGVHRHTVENRLARIEQILGVDLADVRDASRVWFAVEAMKRSRLRRQSVFFPGGNEDAAR